MAEKLSGYYYPFYPDRAPLVSYDNVISWLYLSAEIYSQTLKRLATQIDPRHKSFIYNLKGAEKFANDLQAEWKHRNIDLSCTTFNSVIYKSTQGSDESGHIQIIRPVTPWVVTNQEVVLLEDIGDTNLTMQQIHSDAIHLSPANLTTAVLLLKMPHPTQAPFTYDFVGCEIDPKWVGGWGLDYGTPDVNENYPRHSNDLLVRIPPELLPALVAKDSSPILPLPSSPPVPSS